MRNCDHSKLICPFALDADAEIERLRSAIRAAIESLGDHDENGAYLVLGEALKSLGRFGHHPDPAVDFCVEVEEIMGMAYNRRVGFDPEPDLDRRIERAMQFRVGGDIGAIAAKDTLREIAGELIP